MATSGPVLAIDPGRDKCGLAVVSAGGRILAREIVPPKKLAERAASRAQQFPGASIIVGRGTGARAARAALRAAGLEAIPVREEGTTLAARALYYREHPPRGWRRLIPITLQVPPVPLDDYAAVVIAERYMRDEAGA